MAHEEDHIKAPKEDQPQQEQQQEDPFAEASSESESGSNSHYEEHPSDPFAEAESESESDSDSGSDSDYDELPSDPQSPYYTRPGEFEDIPEEDNSQDANVRRFARVLQSRRLKRAEEEEDRRFVYHEDLFDFPKDRENWREEDLKELWADAPLAMTKPGWDPAFADEEDLDVVRDEIVAGRDPPIAPFYLPYRKCYPAIPDNHYDISNPKSVIEELDRIEEFLKWVSFIFPDGSSFEGTVWDDLAHGKGVYVTEQGLVRYEGEWLQNNMEGHGVVEVDIPDVEPIPGSKLEAQMRAEGKIIKRDYMTPEDREWLEMDIEDSVRLTNGKYEIPFYENDEWIRQYGEKPEKGRYRYAGQWKHSRMHGCGVYKVNERIIYGRFYFGELVEDPAGCDEETCALHAGIAEVAAAKARMFINKPDGMVREERGPYSDPQHPYFYEEDDAWQAPGFINQFYEVPDYWKTYVHEVDQEREMWLHSFYKAPLRLPMPAELEYWWSKDSTPEFVLVNKEPEPDPEDPSKLLYSEDPLILHTPTGRLINYIEDEEHGLRLFWQPPLKEGEDVDPEKAQFLPLGFDEFYGKETEVKKENFWQRLASSVENGCKPLFDKWGKWIEEQKKAGEMRLKLIEKELELVELELCLEEAIEDMEEELKQEEEAESKGEKGKKEKEVSDLTSGQAEQEDGGGPLEVENGEEEEEEEDEEEAAPTSFGSAGDGDVTKEDKRGNGSRKSPFSSLSFTSASMLSTVPSMLQQSLSAWKRRRFPPQAPTSASNASMNEIESSGSVRFPRTLKPSTRLRLENQSDNKSRVKHYPKPKRSRFHASLQKSSPTASMHVRNRGWLNASPDTIRDGILSLHIPVHQLDSF